MTKQLYEEALADVKKLKEVAEDNAKRALLEAVTPRIRDLIENQLLGEMVVDELEADPDRILKDNPEFNEVGTSLGASLPGSVSQPDDASCGDEQVTFPLDSLRVPNENEYVLDLEGAKALGIVLGANKSKTFESKIRDLHLKVKMFSKTSRLVRETKSYTEELSNLISEVENTYSYLQNNMQDSPKKDSHESVLENYYSTLKQLMEQKTMKNKRTLSEAEMTLKLTGVPDELEDSLEKLGVELVMGDKDDAGDEGSEEGGLEGDDELDLDDEGGEEGGEDDGDELDLDSDSDSDEEDELEEEGYKPMESRRLSDDTIVEIDENMLRREIGRMKALREAADMPKNAHKGSGAGKVADKFEADDLGDPFVDIDLREMDEADAMNELDQAMYEIDDLDQYGVAQGSKRHGDVDDDSKKNMPESIKRKLATELALQTEAKKKAKKAADMKKTAKGKNAEKLKEAYNFYARKFNESVARSNKLKGMLAEAARKGVTLNGGATKSAAETDLRNKLAETNLFNAKLLFTNKLLQNESLTKRQKAEVIERLDEAKNEREVKLVYESLVKTLSSAPSKITESADRGVIGSSSRPSRPASATNTLNEGFESDRWARLAGIVK
jgi:hypothetical protein